MKKLQIINDDYQGHVDICRHACRGIVIYEKTYYEINRK